MSPHAVLPLALLLGLLSGGLALKVQPSQGGPPSMAVPDGAKQLYVDLGAGRSPLEPKPDRLVVMVEPDKKMYQDLAHKYHNNPGVVVAHIFLDGDPPPANAIPMRLGKAPAAGWSNETRGWSNATRDNETMLDNATAEDATAPQVDFSTAMLGAHMRFTSFLQALPLKKFGHVIAWLKIDLGDKGWEVAQHAGKLLRQARVIEVGAGKNAQTNKWMPFLKGLDFELDNCEFKFNHGVKDDNYHCLWKYKAP